MKLLDDIVLHNAENGNASVGNTAGETEEDRITPNRSSTSPADLDRVKDAKAPDSDKIIGPEELELQFQPELEPNTGSFFIDLQGDPALASRRLEVDTASFRTPHSEREEDGCCSSDEDIILFRGRGHSSRVGKYSGGGKTTSEPNTEVPNPKSTISVHETTTQSEGTALHTSADTISFPKHRQSPRRVRATDDEKLIQDYIENMRASGEIDTLTTMKKHNTRDLGGSANEFGVSSEVEDTIIINGNGPSKATTAGHSVHKPPSRGSATEQLDTNGDSHQSDSELDDETLARLIAGQSLDGSPQRQLKEVASDSSSLDSDDEMEGRNHNLDDFDIMDWNRPSLRRKKGKAARPQLNFDVSDSELEKTLQAAWKTDRLKKSQRKKQREELRALGMLGKKASQPDDLKVKYPYGMTIDQVSEEVKTFLLGNEHW